HAAIQRLEFNSARDIANRNAAVVGSQRKIRTTRDENLETDVPLVIVARFGTFSMNVQGGCFDPHLLGQYIGFSLRRRASFDLRSHKDLVPIPSLDRDAAVLFPIDRDGTAG